MNIVIRPELPADDAAVRAVLHAAFPTPTESRLVDLLRTHGKVLASLVAEVDGRVAGQILFSPVRIEDPPADAPGAGLAPVSVLPFMQKQGIGGRLVRNGIETCRQMGFPFAVVLGEPPFYRRFGFVPASRYGLRNDYGVDAEFMAVELRAGGFPPGGGRVTYAREFIEAAG
jgi:putative acetyltransferase